MTLVSSDGTARLGEEHSGPSTSHSWWTPLWLQRRRDADDLARWASEVGWQWAATMDGAGLSHQSTTAGGIHHTVAPQVHSVDPGPPVTLLVQMLPGQVVDDFQEQSHRIAEGMDAPMARIEHFDTGWIKVFLLVDEPPNSQPTVIPAEEFDQAEG
jgi:hypothetical protein